MRIHLLKPKPANLSPKVIWSYDALCGTFPTLNKTSFKSEVTCKTCLRLIAYFEQKEASARLALEGLTAAEQGAS